MPSHSRDICVAMFYFDYTISTEQTIVSVLRSLLNQIMRAISSDHIIQPLTEAYAKRTSLDLGEVCHFLSQAINKFRRVYICIDALDEMDPTYRPEIIQILGNLLTTSDGLIRLFITSRPQGLDKIKTNISQDQSIVPINIILAANPDDLRMYIHHQLELDQSETSTGISMPEDLEQEIVERIIGNFGGMFDPRDPIPPDSFADEN